MSNNLIVFNKEDIIEIAKNWADSKFTKMTPPQAFMLLMIAQAEGLHPVRAMAEYDIIQEKPALKSSAVLSRFNRAGGKLVWDESTDKVATCTGISPNGVTFTVTWDMNRASLAGLSGKDNWKKYPAQMLRARAQVECIRALSPEVLNGQYAVEEVQDFKENDLGIKHKSAVNADSIKNFNSSEKEGVNEVLGEITRLLSRLTSGFTKEQKIDFLFKTLGLSWAELRIKNANDLRPIFEKLSDMSNAIECQQEEMHDESAPC